MACEQHSGFDARIKSSEENIKVIFDKQKTFITNKIFYFALGIIVLVIGWLSTSQITAKDNINSLTEKMYISVSEIKTSQAVTSNNLQYLMKSVEEIKSAQTQLITNNKNKY